MPFENLPNELLAIVMRYTIEKYDTDTIEYMCDVSSKCYQLLPYVISTLDKKRYVRGGEYCYVSDEWHRKQDLKEYLHTRTHIESMYPDINYNIAKRLDKYYDYVAARIVNDIQRGKTRVVTCFDCKQEMNFCICRCNACNKQKDEKNMCVCDWRQQLLNEFNRVDVLPIDKEDKTNYWELRTEEERHYDFSCLICRCNDCGNNIHYCQGECVNGYDDEYPDPWYTDSDDDY